MLSDQKLAGSLQPLHLTAWC